MSRPPRLRESARLRLGGRPGPHASFSSCRRVTNRVAPPPGRGRRDRRRVGSGNCVREAPHRLRISRSISSWRFLGRDNGGLGLVRLLKRPAPKHCRGGRCPARASSISLWLSSTSSLRPLSALLVLAGPPAHIAHLLGEYLERCCLPARSASRGAKRVGRARGLNSASISDEVGIESAHTIAEVAQFALARQDARLGVVCAERQRPIRLEQLSREGDATKARAEGRRWREPPSGRGRSASCSGVARADRRSERSSQRTTCSAGARTPGWAFVPDCPQPDRPWTSALATARGDARRGTETPPLIGKEADATGQRGVPRSRSARANISGSDTRKRWARSPSARSINGANSRRTVRHFGDEADDGRATGQGHALSRCSNTSRTPVPSPS